MHYRKRSHGKLLGEQLYSIHDEGLKNRQTKWCLKFTAITIWLLVSCTFMSVLRMQQNGTVKNMQFFTV